MINPIDSRTAPINEHLLQHEEFPHLDPVHSAAALLATTSVRGDEFHDLAASFGTTLGLVGVYHATTSNPDGTAINFWTPASEGAVARTVGLSNPHMAAADAYGNIYIADKAGQAVLKITTNGLIHTYAGTHVGGFNGDGPAPATSLQISNVNGLFVFPNGTAYLLAWAIPDFRTTVAGDSSNSQPTSALRNFELRPLPGAEREGRLLHQRAAFGVGCDRSGTQPRPVAPDVASGDTRLRAAGARQLKTATPRRYRTG